jgi:THO complex subunit 4
MADYWESGNAATGTETAGAAQPAANGDANMDDEILVSPNDVIYPRVMLIIV